MGSENKAGLQLAKFDANRKPGPNIERDRQTDLMGRGNNHPSRYSHTSSMSLIRPCRPTRIVRVRAPVSLLGFKPGSKAYAIGNEFHAHQDTMNLHLRNSLL